MNVIDHVQVLRQRYLTRVGFLSAAIVALVDEQNEEQAQMHARAVVEFTNDVNDALVAFIAERSVQLGRDNVDTFLTPDDDDAA